LAIIKSKEHRRNVEAPELKTTHQLRQLGDIRREASRSRRTRAARSALTYINAEASIY
jgi:hypothetical protein